MSYPPYGGGGGYPPQGGGYPPAGGYPPQQQQYPMGQQPYPGGGAGGYPPTTGYPQAPAPGMPQPYPGAGGGGYPAPQPGYGAPSVTQPPAYGGMPTPESAQAAAAASSAPGYSSYGAPAPAPGGYPSTYPSQPPVPPPQTAYQTQAPYGSQPYGNVPPPASYAPPPGGHSLPPPQAAPPRTYSPGGQYPGAQYPAAAGTAQMTSQMGHMSLQQKEEGTIKPKPNFNGQNEAEILRKAMKGLGTDEKAIIHVVTSCSNAQRQQILLDYKTMFGRDLVKDFKSELGGKLEKIVLALMVPTALFDAKELKRAMKGIGTDEECLIEIMCTRSNAEIQAAKVAYKKEFGKDLEHDLRHDTSGHFQRLMISMSVGGRDENPNVDLAKAQADARALYDAGEKKWGTDESRFNVILCSRSFPQLRATFDEYGKIAKRDIEKSIKSEMSGDLERGMLTIVKVVRNKALYFAEQLYKSMKGLGTDDPTLIRVMVSRCEKDMVQIKNEFKRTYQQGLGKYISGDTSGDYKKILLAICGGEN
uniref:Annexin n=1 Tax=Saccoglossus kowalevskii TaxID=10224 RepID=A0ABM0GV77_SACKO|nr:PREDICTED: annexin A11-like isoform X1 [Saccoglossus kowalevskii]